MSLQSLCLLSLGAQPTVVLTGAGKPTYTITYGNGAEDVITCALDVTFSLTPVDLTQVADTFVSDYSRGTGHIAYDVLAKEYPNGTNKPATTIMRFQGPSDYILAPGLFTIGIDASSGEVLYMHKELKSRYDIPSDVAAPYRLHYYGIDKVLRIWIRLAYPFHYTEDLEYYDIPANAVYGNPKRFMITFDDGPCAGQTELILQGLAGVNNIQGSPVKAAFFMVGDANGLFFMPGEAWLFKGSVRHNQELVRRVASAGHIIGNHSMHHAYFGGWPSLNWLVSLFWSTEDYVKKEILDCDGEISGALNRTPLNIFRAPYLIESETVRNAVEALGFKLIEGELVHDTSGGPLLAPSVDEIKANCLQILNGWASSEPCILIFHDVCPSTYNNIGNIVCYLQDQGFQLVDFDPGALPQRVASVRARQGLQAAKQDPQNLVLSWPAAATNVVLETTLTMAVTNSWSPVNAGALLSGDKWTLTVPMTASNAFYRLTDSSQP